jgi:hypothetical protein
LCQYCNQMYAIKMLVHACAINTLNIEVGVS